MEKIIMVLGKEYIKKLRQIYIERTNDAENWAKFNKVSHGATDNDLNKLIELFPDIPESLIEILKEIDGTYYRKYGEYKVCIYLFGSSDGYPHYLFSAKQMAQEFPTDWIEECIDWNLENNMPIDERITKDYENLKWMQFTDCMNNGGTSQFYIDFSPSEKGKYGQIVEFVHDPDEFNVIADSFDEFLQLLIDGDFKFIDADDPIYISSAENE